MPPPKLKCHYDLDLWSRNPKFNKGHLIVMTNYHTKLEYPRAMSSLVTDRTRFVYGLTCAKQYTPSGDRIKTYSKNDWPFKKYVYLFINFLVQTIQLFVYSAHLLLGQNGYLFIMHTYFLFVCFGFSPQCQELFGHISAVVPPKLAFQDN